MHMLNLPASMQTVFNMMQVGGAAIIGIIRHTPCDFQSLQKEKMKKRNTVHPKVG